jgi:hypothetical protein
MPYGLAGGTLLDMSLPRLNELPLSDPCPGRRSAGRYFTDGARLLLVHALAVGRHAGAVVEDCRTLELFFVSGRELNRLGLQPVVAEIYR